MYTFNVTSILLYICIHSDVHNDNQVRIVQPLALFEIVNRQTKKRKVLPVILCNMSPSPWPDSARTNAGEDEGHVHPNALQRSSSEASRQPRRATHILRFFLHYEFKREMGPV